MDLVRSATIPKAEVSASRARIRFPVILFARVRIGTVWNRTSAMTLDIAGHAGAVAKVL